MKPNDDFFKRANISNVREMRGNGDIPMLSSRLQRRLAERLKNKRKKK
ncbi:hypothetical protein [Chishuiella sp.]|nr:hypothetical protein [Chishuiella sp.]